MKKEREREKIFNIQA